MEGKYLITTDAMFLAPDGQYYQGAWGTVKVLTDGVLGVKTNRNATNWFAMVGSADNHIIIAGCQIHYAVKCDKRPPDNPCILEEFYEGENVRRKADSRIYIAE
jgi:hypothetical protein